MRRIVPFAAALCLGACAAVSTQPAAAPSAPATTTRAASGAPLAEVDVPYTKFVLANGLTVLIHEDHKAPLVGINIWYHVGSRDEPSGRHGFAHLFEHLMFTGSQHYDDEYFRALEPAGAVDINGTTNDDRTNFFETVPTSAFARTLWLESDRMGYLSEAITQAKLDQQREVVENEKRQDENQPYGKVDDVIARETYPVGHPYSWTTIGSEADLNAATLSDVKTWFKSYYGPNNAVLSIAGDVDTAQAKALVERYFGSLPPGPPVPHVKAWPAPLSADKRVTLQDAVPLPRLYIVWNVPGDGVRDSVLLDLFGDVLGGGKSSRLYQRLVYRDQIASSVSAGAESNEIGGQFQIEVTAKPGAASDALNTIETATREELAKLLSEGPTADELARVESATNGGIVRGLEKVGGFGGKAGLLASNQTYHDDPAHYKIELAWQRAATPQDVRDAAQNWLAHGSFTLQVQPQPTLKADGTGADRSSVPALDAPPALKLPTLQRTTLSNGLKVILAERHAVPVVEVQALFDAGRAADAGGKSGTAALALDMLDEGAGSYDALGMDQRRQQLGATMAASTSRDTSTLGLSALKPNLSASLDLLAVEIEDPKFPAGDLARFKQRMLAAIAREKAQPFGAARRVLSRLLYGEGHPYAYAGVGLERDVAAISRDDLVAFQRRWLRPDNATLVVVGDTTLAEMQPLLEAKFGRWQAPAAALPQKNIASVALPSAPRVYLIDKPGADQSLILGSNLAPPASDPAHEAMETVNTALGGMFISRLNLNLRQAKHWSYGASSFIAEARGPQIFAAYAEIERAHTAEALAEMKRELEGIAGRKPLNATEIEAAKKSQLLALPGSFESSEEVAGAIDAQVEFGLPDDYWNKLVPTIEALTPAQLAGAADQLVKPAALTWIVVGDLSKIEASVRKLQLGTVQVLDADGVPLR
ncbi:MAG: peptidase domain protein [Nevskia sp.]|nr:peptidase domain protein [Nevskia sp.]